MAFINFIETFFFISLGITFILILLLVHHFKQRIVSLEQKYDTTFEIINNIVKEMGNIRNMQFNVPHYSLFPKTNLPDSEKSDEKIVNMILQKEEKNKENEEDVLDDEQDDENSCNNEDKEDDEDDEDSNEDSNDEYSNDEYSNDEDQNDEDIEESIVNVVDQENGQENVPIYPSIIKINMDTIDISQNIIINNTIENNIELQEENIKIINIENKEVSSDEFQTEINPEIIHIEKKDTYENEINDNDIHSTQTHVEEDTNQPLDNSKDIYKKMNLQTLKTLVITKGLSSDPSRMKKPELIKLLESLVQ